MNHGGERGSATVWVLALAGVLALVGLAGVLVGAAAVARHRAGSAADLTALAAAGRAVLADPHAFADAWRALYPPAMEECRSGRRPYTRLDVLNRETLDTLLATHVVVADPASVADFAMAWRRLDPWPDGVAGLTRLRARVPIVIFCKFRWTIKISKKMHNINVQFT